MVELRRNSIVKIIGRGNGESWEKRWYSDNRSTACFLIKKSGGYKMKDGLQPEKIETNDQQERM